MSLPSINFLHLTVSEIQPGQTFSRHPPAHPDTMGENNTPTALKAYKVLITHLVLVLEVCNVKPSFWKLWAGNLLMRSDLTLSPSFNIKRGQPNLKCLNNGSLALVSCLSGGYRFASVLQCVGLVLIKFTFFHFMHLQLFTWLE